MVSALYPVYEPVGVGVPSALVTAAQMISDYIDTASGAVNLVAAELVLSVRFLTYDSPHEDASGNCDLKSATLVDVAPPVVAQLQLDTDDYAAGSCNLLSASLVTITLPNPISYSLYVDPASGNCNMLSASLVSTVPALYYTGAERVRVSAANITTAPVARTYDSAEHRVGASAANITVATMPITIYDNVERVGVSGAIVLSGQMAGGKEEGVWIGGSDILSAVETHPGVRFTTSDTGRVKIGAAKISAVIWQQRADND